MARIILSHHGLFSGTYYNLSETISIGRAAENTVQLTHDSVSERHARIALELDHHGCQYFVLEDLGSKAGCYLNRKRVKRQRLQHKDLIRIGHVQFTFFNHKELLQTSPLTDTHAKKTA